MNKITIDARMIESSGIGTVTQHVLQYVIAQSPDTFFYLLGSTAILQKYPFFSLPNVQCISCDIPIYSAKEQLVLLRKIPSDTNLLWIPHYNIPLLYTGKMLVTVHDIFHLAMPQFVKRIDKKIYARTVFNAVARKAEAVVADSYFTKKELIKYTNIIPEKVKVIYCGVDEYWKTPLYNTKSIQQTPYILYVGNVKPHKNLPMLIKAFVKLYHDIPHRLVIVGKKEGFITVDKLVFNLAKQYADHIQFTGYISNEQLKNYYHYADLLVFPTLYEGFGLPPLEAMAAGCPRILCSDIPVLKEVYGDSVQYFDHSSEKDLANKIRQILNQKPIKSDKNFIDQYTWENTGKKYLELMKKMIERKNN